MYDVELLTIVEAGIAYKSCDYKKSTGPKRLILRLST